MNGSITIIQPKVDKETLEKINNDMGLEGQVTIHISFTNHVPVNQLLRIWKTTYLFDKDSSNKSKLIQHYNISFYPKWMIVNFRQTLTFTLVFSALPRSCKHFELIEQIPEPGGFVFKNIARNSSDVYHLTLQ